MKPSTTAAVALVILAAMAVPMAIAEHDIVEQDAPANLTISSAQAVGYVYVNVTEPQPEPFFTGFGTTGFLTYNTFDFGGLFRWLAESVSSLLGI